jgi:hypothetical protein
MANSLNELRGNQPQVKAEYCQISWQDFAGVCRAAFQKA